MRKINVDIIKKELSQMLLDANYSLCDDIKNSIVQGIEQEESPIGKDILQQIKRNYEIAEEENVPLCQDTGMVVIFIDIGQEVHITGGFIEDAINDGIREAYINGYLRKSIVIDPIKRENTGDNTPPVIHYNITKGDKIKITVMPKGFGSENTSKVKMLKPSDGIEGVKNFVIETVRTAGPNGCPPYIIGVGIGGTIDKCTILSKKALLRDINTYNTNKYYEELEKELKNNINNLGIGPMGLGGRITALGVNVEVYPTHIAGLPVAVNISCHASRHKTSVI